MDALQAPGGGNGGSEKPPTQEMSEDQRHPVISLGPVAATHLWLRPVVVDEAGRHAAVEAMVALEGANMSRPLSGRYDEHDGQWQPTPTSEPQHGAHLAPHSETQQLPPMRKRGMIVAVLWQLLRTTWLRAWGLHVVCRGASLAKAASPQRGSDVRSSPCIYSTVLPFHHAGHAQGTHRAAAHQYTPALTTSVRSDDDRSDVVCIPFSLIRHQMRALQPSAYQPHPGRRLAPSPESNGCPGGARTGLYVLYLLGNGDCDVLTFITRRQHSSSFGNDGPLLGHGDPLFGHGDPLLGMATIFFGNDDSERFGRDDQYTTSTSILFGNGESGRLCMQEARLTHDVNINPLWE
jgi:hypothetical protein